MKTFKNPSEAKTTKKTEFLVVLLARVARKIPKVSQSWIVGFNPPGKKVKKYEETIFLMFFPPSQNSFPFALLVSVPFEYA